MDERTTPEQQLWIAVIAKAAQDLEDLYSLMEYQLSNNKSIVYLESKLRMLRYEISNSWFDQVCTAADYPRDKILVWMNRREDRIYGRLH